MTDEQAKDLKLFPCPSCSEPNKFAEEINILAMFEASLIEDLEYFYKKEKERLKSGVGVSEFNIGRLDGIEEVISIIRRDEVPEDYTEEEGWRD